MQISPGQKLGIGGGLLVAGSVGLHLLESFHGIDWLKDGFPPLYGLAINPTFKAGVVIVGAIFALLGFIELRRQRHDRQEPNPTGTQTIVTSGQARDVIIGNKTEEHHYLPPVVSARSGNTSVDQATLSNLRSVLPESTIGQLRGQPHQQFPTSIKPLLLTFLQATEGPDHAFLDEQLEELRGQLRHKTERLVELLSGGHPSPVRNSLVSRMARQQYHNDLSWRSQGVCSAYDALIIAARRKFDTISDQSHQQANISADASVAGARLVQGTEVNRDLIQGDKIGGDKVYGNKIVGNEPSDRPHVTLRLLPPTVQLQNLSKIVERFGDSLVLEITSHIQLRFEALNTASCPTTIDQYYLEISTPSGRPIILHDTAPGILMETLMSPPSGFRSIIGPVELRQGITERRFVRYLSTERMTIKGQNIPKEFPNQMFLEKFIREARDSSEDYERDGEFCLRITDSYGQTWSATWRHP